MRVDRLLELGPFFLAVALVLAVIAALTSGCATVQWRRERDLGVSYYERCAYEYDADGRRVAAYCKVP